jgi:hypothetical protein
MPSIGKAWIFNSKNGIGCYFSLVQFLWTSNFLLVFMVRRKHIQGNGFYWPIRSLGQQKEKLPSKFSHLQKCLKISEFPVVSVPDWNEWSVSSCSIAVWGKASACTECWGWLSYKIRDLGSLSVGEWDTYCTIYSWIAVHRWMVNFPFSFLFLFSHMEHFFAIEVLYNWILISITIM